MDVNEGGVTCMLAVVYIAHGTKLPAGIEEATSFVAAHKEAVAAQIQIVSFLDFADPSPIKAIDLCVKRGATKIAIVPILLLAAGHAKDDIPRIFVAAKRKYPHITFVHGSAFGVDDRIVDVLVDRIHERAQLTARDRILLVARGSSDAHIKTDVKKIRDLLLEKVQVDAIDVCYLAGQQPTFLDSLQAAGSHPSSKTFVVPYLLFTGKLMHYITDKVTEGNDCRNGNFFLCRHLGLHEQLSDFFLEQTFTILSRMEKGES